MTPVISAKVTGAVASLLRRYSLFSFMVLASVAGVPEFRARFWFWQHSSFFSLQGAINVGAKDSDQINVALALEGFSRISSVDSLGRRLDYGDISGTVTPGTTLIHLSEDQEGLEIGLGLGVNCFLE